MCWVIRKTEDQIDGSGNFSNMALRFAIEQEKVMEMPTVHQEDPIVITTVTSVEDRKKKKMET